MMRHKNFACFILTHGRPDNQKTLSTLLKQGYTGKIYLIVDNEDITAEQYKAKYDNVIVFDKEEAAKNTDRGDVIQKKNTVLFARNMCHEIAANLGLEYFLELDDDYSNVKYRYDNGVILANKTPESLDAIFDCYLDFLDVSNAKAVCFAQGGDLICGRDNFHQIRIKRKAMNAFFCRTDRPFKFVGRMNDDVNTYVTLSHKGHIFFTVGDISINQADTQQNAGGLTEMYKENGTYMKSFYTIMMCPSAVKISTIGSHVRIHHRINWKYCAPKIMRQDWKKEAAHG